MLAQHEHTIVQGHRDTALQHGVANDTNSTGTGGLTMADDNRLNAYQQNDNYNRVPQPGLPAYTEAWALIESARRMATSADFADQDNIADRNKVRDTVRLNWRLWTIFQAEMTVDDQESVPDEIRMNMLTLCKFVDEHTVETLKEPTPEKVSTLIEINRNIAAGLLDSLKQLQAEMGGDSGDDSTDEVSTDEKNVKSIATNV